MVTITNKPKFSRVRNKKKMRTARKKPMFYGNLFKEGLNEAEQGT